LVSAVELAAGSGLTLAAGAVLAGVVRLRLRLLERCLIAIVAGIVLSSAMTYGLALVAGLNVGTALGGPAVIVAAGAVASWTMRDPLAAWRQSWRDERERWHARTPWFALAVGAAAAGIVGVIFSRAVFVDGAGLQSGYATVWADWSQHLTTQASFAVAGNVPPTNPLFSGTPLLYPFLADFQSAVLVVLGASPAVALATPSALLVLVVALLIVCLGLRLGVPAGGGALAALIVFLGGGIGFVGLFGDACTAHGFTAAQCTVQYVVTHPGTGAQVVGATLHDLPGVVAAQPRAYDGLPSDGGGSPLPNMQWYTPLLAWWLPQRTIVYGFAAALVALVLVSAALREAGRHWSAFALAGVLIGILPILHIQTFIALAIVLLVLALLHRRREWLALAAVAVVLAAPRLVQVAAAPHGSAAFGNEYPWFEPGWMANPSRIDVSPGGAFLAIGEGIGQLVSPRWWGFWVVNVGIAVPLSAVVVLLAAGRRLGGRAGAAARRVTSVIPAPALELFLAGVLVFAICNVVVFQSWDWDNTKLFVYWYLAVALVLGALAAHWWRRFWPRIGVGAMAASVLLTGIVVMLRFAPWTPPRNQVGGPYTIVSAAELTMASRVAASTPGNAVFLTFGRPNDPLLAAAGRTGVMGYYGWLWSYGTAFGSRYIDVVRMYQGCAASAPCTVPELLRRYDVSYVEIDDRVSDPGAITANVGFSWWRQQGFPVVASDADIVVYDVRGIA
jgi:hypothetical protein